MIPSGSFIRTSNGVFLIKNNKRFRVLTKAILDSWRPFCVADVSEKDVTTLPIVGKLPWRDGTLVYNASTGIIYLMSDSKKRRIVGGDTMRQLGLSIGDALIASNAELEFIDEGGPLE